MSQVLKALRRVQPLICSLLFKALVPRVPAKLHTSPPTIPPVTLGTNGLKVLVAVLLGSTPPDGAGGALKPSLTGGLGAQDGADGGRA